ncbi:hypothetical protein MBH78_09140 [Oceanimonas sp. NS1]|nr:hypothetical protein [Oceanimonas sp. NS1]
MNKLLAILASFGLALSLQAAELPGNLEWETNDADPILPRPRPSGAGVST